jgi:hypothetical protein
MVNVIKKQSVDEEIRLEHLAWCLLDHNCEEAIIELSSNELINSPS